MSFPYTCMFMPEEVQIPQPLQAAQISAREQEPGFVNYAPDTWQDAITLWTKIAGDKWKKVTSIG